VKSKETGAHLEGSWTVDIGDQDEAGICKYVNHCVYV